MAQIGTIVTDEIKAQFDLVARSRGTTSSRLAATIIAEFLRQGGMAGRQSTHTAWIPPSPVERSEVEAKTEQVFVRLEPFYFQELGRLAQERLWYRGTYLANLFRAHVSSSPVLCEAEINAVRQVARQLADMGRNINQIARKLNVSPEHAHLVASLDFELVKMLIDLETDAIKNLMRANVRGWGVCDAEA
jgi:hypothetical protein